MKKSVFITIVVSVCITMFFACTKSDDIPSAENINWKGKELTFKAKEEIRLSGVSVIAGGKEYKATSISNTSGDMGSLGGAIFKEGSTMSFTDGRVFIIFINTTVKCAINNASGKASKAYLYLDNGSKIEIKL